jgi:hypothetical protein
MLASHAHNRIELVGSFLQFENERDEFDSFRACANDCKNSLWHVFVTNLGNEKGEQRKHKKGLVSKDSAYQPDY